MQQSDEDEDEEASDLRCYTIGSSSAAHGVVGSWKTRIDGQGEL